MTTGNGWQASGGAGIGTSVRPIGAVVGVHDSTSAALAAMDAAGLDFVPVVDGAGTFAGLVLRPGVERGCRGMGHEPETCVVANHLKRNVRSYQLGEELDRGTRAASLREPVVVLGEGRTPVGVLDLAG